MIISSASLNALRVGFKAHFQKGFEGAPSLYTRVSTVVPSTTRQEKYGWLGKVPNVREWIGDRVIQNLGEHDYAITNRSFELTIGVDRDNIEDDNLGQYAPMFQELGRAVKVFPDQLVWAALAAGFATLCYDDQYYFDTDHPVTDVNGEATVVANTDGGSGTAWYLVDSSRALKPIIYQERRPFELTNKDRPEDDNVFNRREYIYGTDGRCNVGYGFWQMAWGSKQTLDAAHYATARAALSGMKGDFGRPLGLAPNLLIVPPSLESAGRKLLNSEMAAGGETNEWKGTAELLVVPWLA